MKTPARWLVLKEEFLEFPTSTFCFAYPCKLVPGIEHHDKQDDSEDDH
jgi:hypothetical protein